MAKLTEFNRRKLGAAAFVLAVVIALVLAVKDQHRGLALDELRQTENNNGDDGASELLSHVGKPWTGDLDGMEQRGIIRALVVYNSTHFFFDEDGRPRGISYENLKAFESFMNRDRPSGKAPLTVLQIPVRRNQIKEYLLKGYADIAAASLTITPERSRELDFSRAILSGVKEIVVTGPNAAEISSLDDLSGKTVWVRESSSYYESLIQLNKEFVERKLEPVEIVKAAEQLETEHLLELVNDGVIDITVVDDYLAQAWKEQLDDITLHPTITVHEGASIGWMFRKNSPLLKSKVDEFVRKNRQGTLFANVLIDRYFVNNKWLGHGKEKDLYARLEDLAPVFKQYAKKYEFDWLMLAAQAYQESKLDQSARSSAGAVGIMQILPSTAEDKHVGIKNIDKLENNVHAGAKYLRFILDRYFDHSHMDEMNKHFFAFASYNAGPKRIRQMRKKAAAEGFDPDIWFQNVEVVVAREVGREPVQYVENIFKNYVAYKLTLGQK